MASSTKVRLAFVFGLALLAVGCKPSRRPVSIFAAASLARALGDFETRFEAKYPELDLQLEISGSQTACRKIAELNRRADVLISADDRLINTILRPEHARFSLRFATNELVIAHAGHSRYTDTITAENWASILTKSDVRLGMVDPDQAPIGYRTQLLWRLAGQKLGRADLAQALRARCRRAHIQPHESELLRLLQARAIDYAFVYRSSAEEHNLKVVRLPPVYNLGSAAHAADYAKAQVSVLMVKRRRETITGAPVIYGLTIPRSARRPADGARFVVGLLAGEGRRALQRSGFSLLSPPETDDPGALPASLATLLRSSKPRRR